MKPLGLGVHMLYNGLESVDYPAVKVKFKKFKSRELAMEVLDVAMKSPDDNTDMGYRRPGISVHFVVKSE